MVGVKQVSTESSNIDKYLRAKQEENTETPPLNDECHKKILVEPGKMITINNELKMKFQEEFQVRFCGKQIRIDSSNIVKSLRVK